MGLLFRASKFRFGPHAFDTAIALGTLLRENRGLVSPITVYKCFTPFHESFEKRLLTQTENMCPPGQVSGFSSFLDTHFHPSLPQYVDHLLLPCLHEWRVVPLGCLYAAVAQVERHIFQRNAGEHCFDSECVSEHVRETTLWCAVGVPNRGDLEELTVGALPISNRGF